MENCPIVLLYGTYLPVALLVVFVILTISSSTSQGRAEHLCARITGLNREVSEGKADI